MRTQSLRYFIKIAELRNITLAAKQLFISQPSLSNQLKVLENELGVTLIERNSRSIELTKAGYLLYEYAKKQIENESELRSMIGSDERQINMTLKIGVFPSSFHVLSESLSSFFKKYEQINIELHEADYNSVILLLESQTIDCGIVRQPVNISENIEIIRQLTPERATMVYDPRCFSISEPTLSAIADLPLLISRGNEFTVTHKYHELNLTPQIRVKTVFVSSLLQLARDGVGVALLPESYSVYARSAGLSVEFLPELGSLSNIAVLRRRGDVPNPIIGDLADMLEYNKG